MDDQIRERINQLNEMEGEGINLAKTVLDKIKEEITIDQFIGLVTAYKNAIGTTRTVQIIRTEIDNWWDS